MTIIGNLSGNYFSSFRSDEKENLQKFHWIIQGIFVVRVFAHHAALSYQHTNGSAEESATAVTDIRFPREDLNLT